jgi:hypothetical protein
MTGMIKMKKTFGYWLLFVAALHVIGGLLVPFIAYSDAFASYAAQLGATFWNGGQVPVEAERFQRWIVALFGPTVASVGVLMFFLVRAGMRTRERWPWDALLLAMLAWGPADIAISLMHGFWPHVVIDVVAIVSIVVPALYLRLQASKTFDQERMRAWTR